MNSSGTIVETADITATDLEGRWEMYSMTSDTVVDLNFDGTYGKEILLETTCFKNMFFTFEQDSVITGQAKLDFGENGDIFKCGFGTYSATYKIDGEELLITFTLDGVQITRSKTIALTSDATGEYLHISLEDTEAAQYVDDPGNTVASDVQKIETVYKKQ